MKTDDPRDRMGVYKRLSDVPPERRLERFAGSYQGRDTWKEAVDNWDLSTNQRERFELAEQRWKDHMAERGRHHALATPECCETWAQSMLEEYALSTVKRKYWSAIRRFYFWLQWQADHPHLYQPPLMAVVEYPDGAAAELWRKERAKVQKVRQEESRR